MAAKCEECGCICKRCNKHEQKHNDMHLHVEIENLRQRIVERDHHIVTMETQFLNEAEKFPNGEMASLKEEVIIWQDKYARLCEAHKRVQKVNQNLEDKLLRIVDKCETEKGAFTKDIATLSHRLADANYTIHRLTQDNEKYRNDVNLAIQLLQCKPSNFVGQKYESLPPEVQAKVRSYVAQKGRICESSSPEVRSITVPISTFPPTAMVYNVAKPVVEKQDVNSDDESKPPIDVVSAAIMAKVLEDREKERIFTRHCNTCTCHRSVLKVDAESQTTLDNEKLPTTKDYFSNELKGTIISKENLQLENRDSTVNYTKSFSPLSESNAKRATFHCINEVAEAKQKLNSDHSKLSNCYSVNGNAKNYLNLKNSSQQRNLNSVIVDLTHVDGIKPKTINDEDRSEAQNNHEKSPSERKSVKEIKNLDDQAKIDMINERLWKSSWMSTQSPTSPRDSEAQLDVINERDWRRSSSRSGKGAERPARLTVIEVKSADDLTSQGEKTQSSSFGGDSPAVSSSDPSSLSSDPVPNQPPSASRRERVAGPRNCLVRVTPGSKNILLDNVDTYQTVLYTSGCSRPNTALVHLGKSSRSGRSAADSVSSEENSPAGHDSSSHLQRVAQWVDTLSSDCEQRNVQSVDISSSEEPLLSSAALSSPKNESPAAGLPEDQRDLMTFEGSSDDERRLNIAHDCQANITKEIEEAYLKLAASLETPNLRPKPVDIDLMTIEKYRTEQKRSRKSSLAKSQPKT